MTEPKIPLPPDPETFDDLPDPHPLRWNKPKMAEFLRVLASSHSVAMAARSVGMSRQSAYQLRARLKGEPFDLAWGRIPGTLYLFRKTIFLHADNLPTSAPLHGMSP